MADGVLAVPVSLAREFWVWWTGELAALVPLGLRGIFRRRTDRLILEPDDARSTVAVSLQTSRGRVPLGSAPAGAMGVAATRAIAARRGLMRSLDRQRLPLAIRLPADAALRVAFDLPDEAERNLREAASYQIDRHTPFRPEDVAFGVAAIGRNAGARTVRIELVAVPRARLAAASAISVGLGVGEPRIEVAGAGAAGIDLRPLDDSAEQAVVGKRRRADWLSLFLLLIAAGVATAAIALPIQSTSLKAARLADEFAVVKRQAEEAAALRNEIETAREQSRFLIDRKRSAPNLSRLLQDVTGLLPDGTWLTEFQMNGSELQLSGVTASASSLVSLLERSGIVKSTSFRAPVVQEAKGERFQISARLVESGSP